MTGPAVSSAANLAQSWATCLRTGLPAGGPEWLQTLRAAAATEFLSNGLPGNKDEAWKYTSLRRLEDLGPALDTATPGAAASDWLPLLPGAGGFGFRYSGGTLRRLETELPSGVTMLTLADAVSSAGRGQLEALRPLLEAIEVDGRGHAFEALNTALLSEGIVIHVAAGIDAGLCQAQWGCGSGMASRLGNFRLVIILEPGARLSLLEQFCSPEQTATQQESTGQALNVIVQAQLADDAMLQHLRLQKEASSNILFTFGEVQQAQRSSYSYTGFDIGGGLVRHSIRCRLQGQGACAQVNGAFVLDHERHLDHHICIDHLAPSCRSEQFFRGVLGGRSRGVFNGKALIRSGADGSQVRQSNANLLLSDQAEIDTKPELEIYADDVEASHGATVGSLDEQAVFYLRSRGIPQAAARRMLTSAFCRVVTARLSDTGIAAQIAAHLDDSMPALL